MDSAISEWIRDTQEGVKMSRETLRDGESVIISAGKYTEIGCCDCGLVHDVMVSYDPLRRLVSMTFERNAESTKKDRSRIKRRREGVFKRWKSGAK